MLEKFVLKVKRSQFIIPFLAGVGAFLSAMSSSILLPALPSMQIYFNTRAEVMQGLVSASFCTIAIFGIIYGSLSQVLGRKRLLLGGLALIVCASLVNMCAWSLNFLFIFQILQGAGMAACSVLPLALIKDIYQGKKGTKIIASLGLMIPLAPALAPLCGGYITQYISWRGIYLVVALVGASLFFGVRAWVPETLDPADREKMSLRTQVKGYFALIMNGTFMRIVMISCFASMGVWVYYSTAPFVFIQQLGVSASHYGFYPLLTASGILLGNFFLNRFVHRWPLATFIRIGSIFLIVSSIDFLIVTWMGCTSPFPYALMMMGYLFGFGIIYSAGASMAIDLSKKKKGYGAAFYRSSILLCASMGISLAALVFKKTFMYPALLIVFFGLVVGVMVWWRVIVEEPEEKANPGA